MRSGDPVIHAVLDELLELTGWDPASFVPENSLCEDLDLAEEAIFRLIKRLESKLELPSTPKFDDISKLTLRDLVGGLKDVTSFQAAV